LSHTIRYNLPESWVWANIGIVSDVITKGSTPTSYGFRYIKRGINFVKVENILNGRIARNSIIEFITNEAHKFLKRSQLAENDVLFSIAGTIRRIAIVNQDDLPANINQAIAVIRCPWDLICPQYLKTVFESPITSPSISKKPRGVGMDNISLEDIKNIVIPLPPLNEQKRIVARIEELFTKLEAGVEALKKVKAQLKRYRQAVLKYAFEGKFTGEWRKSNKDKIEPASVLLERIKGERKKKLRKKYKELPPVDKESLPELPEGWVWERVANVGEVITGTTPSKSKSEYYGKNFPFYKPTDLNDGYYTRKSEDGLSKKGLEKARLLPAKSILVTCIGATIGKTGFIRVSGASNQQINAIVPQRQNLPEYVYFACISPQFQKSIIDNASATTLPILNKSKFELLSLPLPPIEEQRKIVEEIDRRFSVADEAEKVVEQSLRQAERLRQSILKKAFEGKLVPQDPNDEPAEKLLERIRAEKAAREGNKKKRAWSLERAKNHYENGQ